MKKSYIIIAIIILFIAILTAGGCSQYNSMVVEDENVNKTWANVENQYQRRLDLIPNLVASVKGYAAHESETLEAVTSARAGLSDAYNSAKEVTDGQQSAPTNEQTVKQFQETQQKLQSALGIYVNAVREAYPDLKADQTFLDLMTQLEGTENRIATERNRYNEAVQNFNVKVRRFPASVLASMFGFSPRTPFAADEEAKHAPKVEF